MSRIVLKSPAKLNLYLKVKNKRPDGYHNIVTLFERINLCDDIRFESNTTGKIRIFCDQKDVPTGPKNLIYKVAAALKNDFAIREGVTVWIKKRIPVAAGLAGGSSNAATALIGLNRLWKLKLSQKTLLKYARQVGSDVAFFLYDTPWAVGTQRGDCIKPLKINTKLWHVVVVPKVKMYSWKVYGGLKLQLTKKSDNVTILIRHLKNNNIRGVGKRLKNDLQAEIIRLCPRLLVLKEELKSLHSQGVMISGSGPAVFGLAENKQHAQQIKSHFAAKFSRVFDVRTV